MTSTPEAVPIESDVKPSVTDVELTLNQVDKVIQSDNVVPENA